MILLQNVDLIGLIMIGISLFLFGLLTGIWFFYKYMCKKYDEWISM